MRPITLDAGLLFESDETGNLAVAQALLARPSLFAGIISRRRGRFAVLTPARATAAQSPDTGRGGDAVRRWLLGQGPRPLPPRPSRSRQDPHLGAAWVSRSTTDLPNTGVVLKPGLAGWRWEGWRAWRQAHPNIPVLALLDVPVALDWPEYAGRSAVAALPGQLAALAAGADAVVVPTEAAKAALAPVLAKLARNHVPLVAGPPSILDTDEPIGFDLALAAVPFFVAFDRIEARANTLLLLQIWRDMIGRLQSVPKLVLAGERGEQVEEIKPLLEWNDGIAAVVAEAPGLPSATLRTLALHARGVLAPGFAGGSGALLRDLGALEVPVIASNIPTHAEAPAGARLLSPLDGKGWRGAIEAAVTAAPPGPRRAVRSEPARFLDQIRSLAASL